MSKPKRLLAVLAHPDDECLGVGGTLAYYHKQGVETYLITATTGQCGRFGKAAQSPGPEIVGPVRKKELFAAADILGVREVNALGYMDGSLDKTDPDDIIPVLATEIRRIKPDVVVTFGPEGGYGHPDHIAICQFATAAVIAAAKEANDSGWQVSKLYYMCWSGEKLDAYQAALKKLTSTVDGVIRDALPHPDWLITTVLDARAHWRTVWDAICCHETQMSIYETLGDLPNEAHAYLWGIQEFYRVFSLVNGGREKETDLFDGIS